MRGDVFVPVGGLVRDLGTGLAQAPLGVMTVGGGS